MTRARDIANLVDANGDIVAGALDNVPASNDASALTTGTLAAARLPTTGVDASSLSAGTLASARLPTSGISASAVDTGSLPTGVFPANTLIDIHTITSSTQLNGNTSNAWSNSALQLSVTPQSSSSAFYCTATAGWLVNNVGYLGIRLLRGTTGVAGYTEIGKCWSYHSRNEAWNGALNAACSGYTTPATSSVVTFYTQLFTLQNGSSFYFNYGGNDATQKGTLTVFEFAT